MPQAVLWRDVAVNACEVDKIQCYKKMSNLRIFYAGKVLIWLQIKVFECGGATTPTLE